MSEKHQQLFDSQLPQLQAAYQNALASGMIEPVILILDLQDQRARAIAATQTGDDDVTAMIAECDRRGWAAIVVLPLSAADVQNALSTTLASCRRFFENELQAGRLRFGVFGEGTVSWGTCSIRPGNEPGLGPEPPG